MTFRKEFLQELRWGILISWIQHMEWYVPWHLFLNLCKNITLYLFQCCGEKGHFSVVWYSDKYKLKIVAVIKNNWHFWTLLILGIWSFGYEPKDCNAENSSDFWRASKNTWRCSQTPEVFWGLFSFYTTMTRLISVKTEAESSAERWMYFSKERYYTSLTLHNQKYSWPIYFQEQIMSETFSLIFTI